MQSPYTRPEEKSSVSWHFLLTLACIGAYVASWSVLISDSPSRGSMIVALIVVAPVSILFVVGVIGSVLALPVWTMWKGARAADAKHPPPSGMLTVAPDEGPLAPTAIPKERRVAFQWKSIEWISSGLGIAGQVGGIASLFLGWTEMAKIFGLMFAAGAGGWLWMLNQRARGRF